MGRIIGVANQKGGTGKTTTAVNLSAILGVAGKKTLLIDMDPQGNATSGVGFNLEDKPTIYQVFSQEKEIEEVVYPTDYPNLFLIPSDISLTGAEIELADRVDRENILKENLKKIAYLYDMVVIDAPPSLSLLTINVLTAVDSVIIPIQCEYYALEGLSKLLNTIELVRKSLNPQLQIEGILFTMADFRTRLTLQVIEEVKKHLPQYTFNTVIPRNVKLAEAPSFGKPVYFYEKDCVGTKAYLNLIQEILKENVMGINN